MKIIGVVILLIVILLWGNVYVSSIKPTTHVIPAPTITPTPTPIILNSSKLFDLINKYRVNNGLSSLVWNNSMCPFSNKRLEEIHTHYSHEGYLSNPHPYDTNQDSTGENLLQGFDSEETAVQAWINSPEHKKNILDNHFSQTCISTDTYNNHTFAVQEFASDF